MRKEVRNWRYLAQGDAIVVLATDKRHPRFAGKVDEISEDGSFLWLIQDNGAGRRLIHRLEASTTLLDAARGEPFPWDVVQLAVVDRSASTHSGG